MRIVFMGTPDFAVPSLEILVSSGFDVVGVITAPDRPAGRGQKLKASPVKTFALKQHLKVLQPTNLKNKDFLEELQSLNADLQVVVAFRMLPEVVWDMPSKGTINLHASLLPDYRGAAPINWAIINGEKETGLTTFFIDKEIDTGNLIFQQSVSIKNAETAGELHDRMMQTGAKLVLKTVRAIEAEDAPCKPQQFTEQNKKAPKIFKNDCKIAWNQSTEKVFDFIRGLSPYPAAWTLLNGQMFKIYRAEMVPGQPKSEPGSTMIGEKELKFTTSNGYIAPTLVQLEGKRRMQIDEFLRGYNPVN